MHRADSPWILAYALTAVAALLPPPTAAAVTGAALVGLGAHALVRGTLAERVGDLVIVASVTAAVGALVRLVETNAELRRARDEIAAPAVARERERVARDLHDILGHTLTTIAVKAGLARRLLERAPSPRPGDVERGTVEHGVVERGVAEVRDIEGMSRQALADVRATVTRSREVRLSGELVAARTALRAAGVEADLPSAVDTVAPHLQEVFGYVVREAVTNAVRHAKARRVTVRLGETWIEVDDDGVGGTYDAGMGGSRASGDHPPGAGPPGNGLRGLRERLAAVGGTVEAGRGPRGGFRVRADVPTGTARAMARAGVRPARPRVGAGPPA